jgi:hypothetical protein
MKEIMALRNFDIWNNITDSCRHYTKKPSDDLQQDHKCLYAYEILLNVLCTHMSAHCTCRLSNNSFIGKKS